MKKNNKIVLSIVGILLAVGVIILWPKSGDKVVYNNIDSERPFKGNANARVVVQVYSDFQCPACETGAKYMENVLSKFNDQIKYEYHHFPLTVIHENAFNAALASECANDQGKFWELHDLMFNNQDRLRKDDLKLFAGQIAGMDTVSFNACLDTRAEKDIVNQNIREGENLGIQGTPTFFINGRELNNYSTLEQEIQKEIL
jgi:protein-disulfide isomerase